MKTRNPPSTHSDIVIKWYPAISNSAINILFRYRSMKLVEPKYAVDAFNILKTCVQPGIKGMDARVNLLTDVDRVVAMVDQSIDGALSEMVNHNV